MSTEGNDRQTAENKGLCSFFDFFLVFPLLKCLSRAGQMRLLALTGCKRIEKIRQTSGKCLIFGYQPLFCLLQERSNGNKLLMVLGVIELCIMEMDFVFLCIIRNIRCDSPNLQHDVYRRMCSAGRGRNEALHSTLYGQDI